MARRNKIEFLITAKDTASPVLRRLVGLVAAAVSAGKVAEYANQWRLLENRIKLVTKSSAELVTVQEELIKLSLRSRTPFEATANLYARVARSSRELGLSQQELLDFTETVSKSIRVSGSTAAEASAGVIQFGQALASSRLSGDELRSVLEQMPRLAQAIAEGMGVGIGQLRELGEAGELTSDKVLDALRKSAPAIAAEFAQLSPLVSEAMGNMDTALISFIGRMDEAMGISVFFAEAIIDVADELVLLDNALLGTLTDSDELSRATQQIAIAMLVAAGTVGVLATSLKDTLAFAFRAVGDAAGATAAQIGAFIRGDLEGVVAIGEDYSARFAAGFSKSFTELGEELQLQAVDLIEKISQIMGTGRIAESSVDLTPSTGAADPVTRKQREAMAKAANQLEKMIATLIDSNAAFKLAESIGLDYADALAIVKINTLGVASGNVELEASALALLDLNRRLTAEAEARIEAEKLAAQQLEDSLKFMQSLAEQAARNIQDAFAEFLFDPFEEGVRGMLLGFVNALREMLSQALAFQILSNIPGLGSFFAARAAGGPVNAGQPVLVGERGPELFIPGASGTVMNNSATKASGGAPTFVTNIDARGADPGLIARLPAIMEQRDRQLMLKMKDFVETGSVLI
jgi:tape measure domain-containing protein